MSDLYNATPTFDAEVFAAPGQIQPPSGFQRFKDFITRQLTNVGLLARPIGISALNTTKEVIEMILNLVGPVFVGSTSWILDLVKRIIYSIADQLWIAAQNNLDRYRGVVCSTVACIFASLAVCLPKTNISNIGRFLVIGMSILVYFSKSYLAVGIGFGLVYIMSKFAPGIGIGIDINNYIATPQGFKEDTTKTILDLVSISVLLTAATSGLTFPTDAKSWDDMLKRHSLLHRSFKAWEFGVDKIVEVFETVSRYILKYFFGKEFVSFEHIGEVEQLYDEVIELTRLDINVDIGRDIALANRIEKMYAVYLNLLRVYCKNRDVVAKLQKIGAPLTEFYRRVADKNPKAHVMRKEPVCMAIYGPTGIGKSYLMSRMQQDLLKIAGKFDPDSPTDGLVYSRAIEQEFWDGYTGQPIAIFDDFGQKVDAPQNPNNEFFEIIRAVNIFPYQLHSAALQEKANNPFTSDFVVLTTNLMNFKPTSIVSAEAFTRRIHINCSITLKPEVRVPGTEEQRLDLGRLKEYQEQNNLEFYDLSHLTFTPLGEESMTYEQFIVKVSLLYKKHLDAFEKRQKSNILTAHNPLPTGAFSVNPTWAQPQAIEDEPTRVPRIVLPRRFVYRPQEFNSYFRTNIWSHFSNASDYVRRFILTCWEDMEWFRNYTFDCFMPYYYSFRRYLVITAMSTACISVFANVLWSGEKEFQRAPITTTLVRGILSFHGIAFTSRNAIYFYPTLAGTLVGLTRTVVRDILKHSIYHQVFDIHCHVCNKHKKLINNIKPAPESADPIELLCELGSDQEEDASFESANKVPVKERINLEAVKMPKKRKDESVEEFQERYLVQAKSWLEDFKDACNTIVIDKLSKEDTEKLLYTRGFMTKTDRKKYEENHKVSAESSMKVQAQKSVQFEGTSLNHGLEEDVTFESSMKHPVSKQCVNIESETKQILMKEAQTKLDNVTALCESRERDDTTKKRASYEGIRCQQLESLKTMAQRNTWLLSSYIYGFKNDVGFVTVLKGHKALMNFHYFQILAKHFKDIPEEEHRLLFSYPTQEGGHEIMFKELARTAVPLMRGLIQTEFYIVTLPSTCNLGRDLTKHLIEPAKITNLDRGLPLHLCTFRKDANGNWRSTTIAGPLEKITTSDVADLLEEGKTHRYLESVYYLAPTKGGDCGNPIFIDDDAFGKKLLGFHFAGLPGKGICAIVTAKDLEDNLKNEMCLSDPVNIDLGMDDEDFPMKDSSFTSRV